MDQSDLSRFIVVEANADQCDAFYRCLYVAFGCAHWPITIEQLKELFAEMDASEWGKDGKLQLWVLVDRGTPDGDGYSFVQTIRRRAFVRPAGSQEVKEDAIYSVGPLCTPVEYRRRGYAHRLMRIMHYILGNHSDLPPIPPDFEPIPNIQYKAVGSVLSSGQPRGWYESCYVGDESVGRQGWVSEEGGSLNSLLHYDIPSESRAPQSGLGYTLIEKKDLPFLLPVISEHYRDKVKFARSGSTVVQADPSGPGWIDDHFDIWTRILPCGLQRPKLDAIMPRGIRFYPRQSNRSDIPPYDASHPFVLFLPGAYGSVTPTVLPIMLQSNLTVENLSQILPVLGDQARILGFATLKIWGMDPEDEVTKAWVKEGGKLDDRARLGKTPLGWCWYGEGTGSGGKGDLVGCELWTLS